MQILRLYRACCWAAVLTYVPWGLLGCSQVNGSENDTVSTAEPFGFGASLFDQGSYPLPVLEVEVNYEELDSRLLNQKAPCIVRYEGHEERFLCSATGDLGKSDVFPTVSFRRSPNCDTNRLRSLIGRREAFHLLMRPEDDYNTAWNALIKDWTYRIAGRLGAVVPKSRLARVQFKNTGTLYSTDASTKPMPHLALAVEDVKDAAESTRADESSTIKVVSQNIPPTFLLDSNNRDGAYFYKTPNERFKLIDMPKALLSGTMMVLIGNVFATPYEIDDQFDSLTLHLRWQRGVDWFVTRLPEKDVYTPVYFDITMRPHPNVPGPIGLWDTMGGSPTTRWILYYLNKLRREQTSLNAECNASAMATCDAQLWSAVDVLLAREGDLRQTLELTQEVKNTEKVYGLASTTAPKTSNGYLHPQDLIQARAMVNAFYDVAKRDDIFLPVVVEETEAYADRASHALMYDDFSPGRGDIVRVIQPYSSADKRVFVQLMDAPNRQFWLDRSALYIPAKILESLDWGS